jgi:hypothetical protein
MILLVYRVVDGRDSDLHLMPPWPTVRVVLLVAGGYGLFWKIGLLAAISTHPHLVGPSRLRIRNSTTLGLASGWDAVAEAPMRRRSLAGGQTRVELLGPDGVLSLGLGSQTSVDVLLPSMCCCAGR